SEILRESGIHVHHLTIYRWAQEYASVLYQIWKKKNKRAYYKWHVDETYIKIKGVECIYGLYKKSCRSLPIHGFSPCHEISLMLASE
ncbi:TPA: IS6 family transposase, partial [Staphylococcus pseudintermedius]|nr:IS6 family transposase [Staphylococcus pseudintermedius]